MFETINNKMWQKTKEIIVWGNLNKLTTISIEYFNERATQGKKYKMLTWVRPIYITVYRRMLLCIPGTHINFVMDAVKKCKVNKLFLEN